MASLTSLLFFLSCIAAGSGLGVFVIRGDPVTFPGTEKCQNGSTLTHRPKDGSDRLVARCDHGVWNPDPVYKDRLSPNKESVTFNRTNVNDGGLYELGSREELIHLNVVLFTVINVARGDSIPLEYFSVTAGTRGTLTVERNGSLVFVLDTQSGNETRGAGYEGRVSISDKWRSEGDFTVTLKGATQEDAGDYIILIQDQNGPRRTAVRVTVSKPDQTTAPTETTTQNPPGMSLECTVTIAVLAVAFIVVLLVLMVVGFRSRRSTTSSPPGAESSALQMPLTERIPPGSQADGACEV